MKTFKLKLELPYNTATKVQEILLKEQKTFSSENYTQIFITTLIIVVKCENNPKIFINWQVNDKVWCWYGILFDIKMTTKACYIMNKSWK